MEASEPVAQTFRWITPYTTKDGQITEILALGLSQPEFAEDGSHIGYLGVSANISEQKLRERTQKKRLEEARELKRQQDNFVEIASHEMGNPSLRCSNSATRLSARYQTVGSTTRIKNTAHSLKRRSLLR